MLDGIKLEGAGVPAVSIVTEPFVEAGRVMGATWGVPDYRFLVTSHPIANRSEEELDRMADELADGVIALLRET